MTTMIIKKHVSRYRKPFMLIGTTLQVVGMVGFGNIFSLDNKVMIIIGATVLRVIMGIVINFIIYEKKGYF